MVGGKITTRRVEKESRRKQKREQIKEQARRRSIGQDMKDNGRSGTKPTRISYSRREEKQLRSRGK